MTDLRLIPYLEMIGYRAWPARENMPLFGWILRADEGITRRANSVLPIEFEGDDLDATIDETIRFYSVRGLPVYFQMTKTSQPQELDEALVRKGFEKELTVHVQTCDLPSNISLVPDDYSIVMPNPTEEWINCFAQATGYTNKSINARLRIMRRVDDHHGYALAKVDGHPAAVGFGVVTEMWLGLFGIATRMEFRRRGAAKAVNNALMRWGRSVGAEKAYLQVETDNLPALRLYGQMGFKTMYTYWYRLLKKNN